MSLVNFAYNCTQDTFQIPTNKTTRLAQTKDDFLNLYISSGTGIQILKWSQRYNFCNACKKLKH